MDVKTTGGQYADAEVIDRILKGDTSLFEVLIRRYNPYLYRIGRAYHYGHEDTEDLMQETFVQAFFNLSGFEQRSSFKTWITRIMLNHCYRKRQRLRYRHEVVADLTQQQLKPLFHQTSNTEKAMVNKELGNVLETALSLIPDEHRIVFTLRELNGMSVADTASALEISEANVKVRLNRARKMLRAEIEKMYTPEEIYEFNLIYCDRIVQRVMERIMSSLNSGPQ